MKLRRLLARRDRRRKARDRQYRKWRKTKKRGHLRAFRRHKDAIRHLNALIAVERERRQITRVIPRDEWDAAPPRGGYSRQVPLKATVIHHTAMPTLPRTASRAEEEARMRQLQQIHQGQGWTDIGYALVVMPSGRIYEGRPQRYVGAHTLGHNTGYGGFALDGNFDLDRPTNEAVGSARRCRELLAGRNRPIYGHHQLNPTACPGKNLKPYVGDEI
jgi:hypothetical protein